MEIAQERFNAFLTDSGKNGVAQTGDNILLCCHFSLPFVAMPKYLHSSAADAAGGHVLAIVSASAWEQSETCFHDNTFQVANVSSVRQQLERSKHIFRPLAVTMLLKKSHRLGTDWW